MYQGVHSIKLIVFGYLIYNEDKILRAFLYFICALPYVQFNKYLIRLLEKSRLYFHFSWLQCDNTVKFYLVLRLRQVLQSTCNLTSDIFQMVSIIFITYSQLIFTCLFYDHDREKLNMQVCMYSQITVEYFLNIRNKKNLSVHLYIPVLYGR